MTVRRRCARGQHHVILVEQWTPLGAVCSCLECSDTFHADEVLLGRDYLGFQHTSPDGPQADRAVYIMHSYLEPAS